MMHPHVIDENQRTVLKRLCGSNVLKPFYLAGGTAAALWLGHRASVDFDWFTREKITDPMALAGAIQEENIPLVVREIGKGALHGAIHGVWVTFLEYNYPLLEDFYFWPEYGQRLASLDDLASMKLAAIASRGVRKDFLDIYAIAMKHRPLKELIELYQKKFSVRDKGHLLYALSFFDDAEKEPMPRMFWDVDWEEIKKTIQKWVKQAWPTE